MGIKEWNSQELTVYSHGPPTTYHHPQLLKIGIEILFVYQPTSLTTFLTSPSTLNLKKIQKISLMLKVPDDMYVALLCQSLNLKSYCLPCRPIPVSSVQSTSKPGRSDH